MEYAVTIFYLKEYFFPMGCGRCGKALNNPLDAYYGLCESCRTFLFSVLTDDRRCAVCGRPLITEQNLCLTCRENEGHIYNEFFVKFRKLFPYTGKFKIVLGSYKFKKSLGIGNLFARYLLYTVNTFYPEIFNSQTSAWVPVPPRPGKIKNQGWDQMEYLAKLLEKSFRQAEDNSRLLPVCRCLKRLHSRTQKVLNREERSKNLKGRILCIKKPPRNAILFDDVITTGATLNTCASALIEAGAEKVYGISLFYD